MWWYWWLIKPLTKYTAARELQAESPFWPAIHRDFISSRVNSPHTLMPSSCHKVCDYWSNEFSMKLLFIELDQLAGERKINKIWCWVFGKVLAFVKMCVCEVQHGNQIPNNVVLALQFLFSETNNTPQSDNESS